MLTLLTKSDQITKLTLASKLPHFNIKTQVRLSRIPAQSKNNQNRPVRNKKGKQTRLLPFPNHFGNRKVLPLSKQILANHSWLKRSRTSKADSICIKKQKISTTSSTVMGARNTAKTYPNIQFA